MTTSAARAPLVVVDAANVVGSVPDGWWRDRRGAATRLRDALAGLAAAGMSGEGVPEWARRPPLEVVLVVEGAARGVESIGDVRVIDAPGEGDDAIVELVRHGGEGRYCLVVTADRALRARVESIGAVTGGPRAVPYRGRIRQL